MKYASLALVGALGLFTQIQLRGLTPEEAQILSHFSYEQTPDGQGGMVPTIVITGANVQIVNGLGSSITKNGTGNLVLGYNALGHPGGDDRTGSHYLVMGRNVNYSGACGIAGGSQNSVAGIGNVILGGSSCDTLSSSENSVIAAGTGNTVTSISCFVGAGGENLATAITSAILGGLENTTGEGSDVAIAGGHGCSASGIASSVGGGSGRSTSVSGAWVGGSFFSPN